MFANINSCSGQPFASATFVPHFLTMEASLVYDVCGNSHQNPCLHTSTHALVGRVPGSLVAGQESAPSNEQPKQAAH